MVLPKDTIITEKWPKRPAEEKEPEVKHRWHLLILFKDYEENGVSHSHQRIEIRGGNF